MSLFLSFDPNTSPISLLILLIVSGICGGLTYSPINFISFKLSLLWLAKQIVLSIFEYFLTLKSFKIL